MRAFGLNRDSIGRLVRGGAAALALGAMSVAGGAWRAAASEPAAAPPAAPAAPTAGGLPSAAPLPGNAALRALLAGRSPVLVAGERVNAALLRRFYAEHGHLTVWDTHPAQEKALWEAVLHAQSQGLDPTLFGTAALTDHAASLSPVERDVLLTNAFLGYADALARGAMPLEERPRIEDLSPGRVDVVAALDHALDAPDPAKQIEALAPASPQYEALRRAYARYQAIAARAVVASAAQAGAPTALRAPAVGLRSASDAADDQSPAAAARRAQQIAVNLERLRWLPRPLPTDRIMVNAAIQQLQLFRQNQPVFTTRVVVGKVNKQTPEFQSTIDDVLFNPPWNIPSSILRSEILPKLSEDPDYLARHHMRWRGPMSLQQQAGPYSALGRIKFEMQDRFDVYLHDTPEKWRFRRARRTMSHGCVRVQNPQELAALLLGESPQAIRRAIAVGYTHRVPLPQSIPVFIVYQTAYADSDGLVEFAPDVYRRDVKIWQYLSRAQQNPVAQDAGLVQRKG